MREPVAGQIHTEIRDVNIFAINEAIETNKEAASSARIRVRNRRMTYLHRHPSYFESHDLELAGYPCLSSSSFTKRLTLSDPLLYDRCIRRFQTAAEREAEGRSKGYSGVLEADLYRSEAKIAALKTQSGVPNQSLTSSGDTKYMRGPHGEILPEDQDDIPQNKEEGVQRWKDEMTMRFLNGKDKDFPYNEVDENDEWDVFENREVEDRWFDDEKPEWTASEHAREGETGIQDF